MKTKTSTVFGLVVLISAIVVLLDATSDMGLYMPGYEPIVTDRFTHPVRVVRKPTLPGKEVIRGIHP